MLVLLTGHLFCEVVGFLAFGLSVNSTGIETSTIVPLLRAGRSVGNLE